MFGVLNKKAKQFHEHCIRGLDSESNCMVNKKNFVRQIDQPTVMCKKGTKYATVRFNFIDIIRCGTMPFGMFIQDNLYIF